VIAHMSLAVKDFKRSKRFYMRVLAPLGYAKNMEEGNAAGFNDGENTDFWISGQSSVVATHVAFRAQSAEQVVQFYKAGIAAGAQDNGAPGYRDYWPGYYAAFVLDPDGHNVEAVWYDYDKAK
jgi:predicted lactoylglutathione lyase